MAEAVDMDRLRTFQHHVDDMRNLVMCKICLNPLYEPFILACGHTYCYGCLRSWFSGLDDRRRNKNCPDCRSEVMVAPSPNYILRDLVHMFINRAELLPEDETVDEHVAGKLLEAELLANDKDDRGLFQGAFRTAFHPLPGFRPLHDLEDMVMRCPICAWELEDGMCNQCGYEHDEELPDFSDEDDESTTNDGQSIPSDDDIEEGLPHHFWHARSVADDIDQSVGTDDYSEHGYGTPNHFGYEEDEDDMDGFIDDHEEEDEPDEDDEDGLGSAPPRFVQRPRGGHYRIPDDEDEDEDEDDGGSLEDGEEEEHGHYNYHPGGPIEVSDMSDEEDENELVEEDEDQDVHTNYDESDEGSRSPTPIAMPMAPRRRPILISDDEDEDEEADFESHTEGRSQSDEIGASEEDSNGSEDTAIPLPASARARQQNINPRKRRRTSNAWRAVARDRDEAPALRQRQIGRRPGPRPPPIHDGRPVARLPRRIHVSG